MRDEVKKDAVKKGDTIHHRSKRWQDDIHATPDVSFITNPDVEHEHTDVSVGPIAKFVVALFIFGVVVSVLMLVLFKFFDAREKTAEPPASPLARVGKERLPPEPRLQASRGFEAEGVNLELKEPQAEMKVVSEKWRRELTNGWTDAATGARGIPIAEAKKIFLEREQQKAQGTGNTTNAPAGQPQSNGQTRAGEQIPSSSGQQTEVKNQ
jgi:hypothetical protein